MDKQEIRQIIKEEIQDILNESTINSPTRLADYIEQEREALKGRQLYMGQDIGVTINFLRNGRPSEVFMKSIIHTLVNMGFEINKTQFKKPSELKPSSSAMVSGPTEPSKGYMGSAWTGD